MQPNLRYDKEDESISSGLGTPISHRSTPEYQYVEEAIPLISFTSSFQLNPDALEFLRSLPSPLAIVGVAGLYRTGKSFLLNRVLLNRGDGFGVGPTVNPCTKGIWIWGKPLTGTTTDGRQCSVVLMDSEGIGALDEDSDHDTRIFSLVMLISSCFIYNSLGALDENAIQNLSLIVNLTKHIHIKSNQSEEVDSEDYAQYFPSFLWIVRDFSLQLVDADGEVLTSKEYLEKVLQPQKGFSDSVEDKNRIRRLLKDFFKDRDCFTLVRPLTQEGDLQNLNKFELEDLRLEFVEQVMQLRARVFNRIKVKTLKTSELNGEMVATLVENYVAAINRGAVPAIDSTWGYVCKTQCTKAAETATKIYEKTLADSVADRFPINEDDLKLFHKEARDKALEFFSRNATGPEIENFKHKLKESIADKYYNVVDDNVSEGQRVIGAFLTENYGVIDNKVKRGDFKSYHDFEKDIRSFQSFFLEHGPDGPFRKELLLEFCQNKLAATADFFVKNLNNELELQLQMKDESMKRLENDLREAKEDALNERGEMQRKITSVESERAELSAKEVGLREQMQNLLRQRDQVEQELRESAKNTRNESQTQVEAANNKVWEYEEQMKELRRKLVQQENEFKEQVALIEQKNKYLDSSLEEARKREKDSMNELKSEKKSRASSMKELQARYEGQIKSLQSRAELDTERIAELERELEHKEGLYDTESSQWEERDMKFNSIIEDLKIQVSTLTQKLERKENDYKKKLADSNKSNESTVNSLKNKLATIESKLKDKEEQNNDRESKHNRESAIVNQKLEFAEQQVEELKQQLADERKQHENMIKTLQSASSDSAREEVEVQLHKFKTQYLQEIKSLEQEYETSKQKLSSQIEELMKKNGDLELQLKMLNSESANASAQLKEENEGLIATRDKLQGQVNSLQAALDKNVLEVEQKLQKKVRELENELEETKLRLTDEVANANNRAEQSYAQLKEFYEQEKIRLEQRINEDKQRADKKYAAMCEEYEDRIREESETYEDELANKEDEIRDIEAFYTEEVSNLKHQAGLDSQKIETLEKYLKDTKEQIETLQKSHAVALEQQQERMNAEREGLVEKVEKLASELANKDREYTSLVYKREQLESTLKGKEAEIEDLTSQFNRTKQTLTERLENYKEEYQKINDEYTQKKSDSKRELALAQQEIEFKTRKIEDLQRSLQETEERYNETVKSLKNESGQELSQTIEKLTQDKESLTNRLEEKRKALKDLNSSTSRQITSLEKEKAVLSEKLANIESKKNDMETRLNQEIQSLTTQLKEKENSRNSDEVGIQLENERLKTKLQEMERDLAEKEAGYERERMLWENKCNFLSQQRDQAKSDLNEHQKKFDAALEELQKRGSSDKEKMEETTNSLIASVESRYASQIKDLQETSAATISQLNDKLALVETNLRSTKEQLELERRGRSTDATALEKRVTELTENENRLTSQLESIKLNYENRLKDSTDGAESEKQQLKKKIGEIEKRAKEAEQARGTLFIEHEKERAKWNLERDHLVAQRAEAQDALERADKRKEALLRENEKLRAERGNRRNQGALFKGRNELSSQQFKQGVSGLLGNAGITFEEFSKERSQDQTLDTPENISEASPLPPRKPPFSSDRRSRHSGDKKD